MSIWKLLKNLYKQKESHFISVDYKTYKRYKWLIKAAMGLNKNYKSCEVFRKKYKTLSEFVVIGLKYSGRNVRRRTIGYAKEFIEKHKNARCLYCERKLTQKNATTDHIIPISVGGNNCQVNLIVCCHNCNSERGNMDFRTYLISKNTKYRNIKILFI
jgi:hypothetical protein